MVSPVKYSTDNTKKLYIHLKTGYSGSIFSDNYLNNVKNLSPTMALQLVPRIKLVGLQH